MTNKDLTDHINEKVNELKTEINSMPRGGGLEILLARLHGMEASIKNFINRIKDLEEQNNQKIK